MSILLFGHNGLVDKLRLLCCLELYLNCDFYASHPFFESTFNANKDLFCNTRYLFQISLSHSTTHTGEVPVTLSHVELVKLEAINSCKDHSWLSMMCALSLSSVIQQSFHIHYPECRQAKYPKLFAFWNNVIFPRQHYLDGSFKSEIQTVGIHLLYCRYGSKIDGMPNHFVPLVKNSRVKPLKRGHAGSTIPISSKKQILSSGQTNSSTACRSTTRALGPFGAKSIFHFFPTVKSESDPTVSTTSNSLPAAEVLTTNVSSVVTSSCSVSTSTTSSVLTTSSGVMSTMSINSVSACSPSHCSLSRIAFPSASGSSCLKQEETLSSLSHKKPLFLIDFQRFQN